MKVLFICKRNETYGFYTTTRRSAGLYNSTRFISESLQRRGIDADIVEVVDNNDIDREVTDYKATHVVIEALWVVPEKFDVLKALHPTVKWYVHMHSGMPFLALEGIALDWLQAYVAKGLKIIANSRQSYRALADILGENHVVFLPNVYVGQMISPKRYEWNRQVIDVGCFGAVRPMKNHLLQAMAAIQFAKNLKKAVRFHINATRIETGGNPVLTNLRALFDGTPNTQLIEAPWMEPEDFMDYLIQDIDIGMQVSLTETFNVVSADYITAGLPVVVSKEVDWASRWSKADDNSIDDIVDTMKSVLGNRMLVLWNQKLLRSYSGNSQDRWEDFFRCDA